MKKSSFVAMMMGTASGVLFALGMCMALLPEWNAFSAGVVLGGIGILLGIVTLIVWRKMEHKAPIRMEKKKLGTLLLGIFGALVFGVGMCLCLIRENFLLGTVIGLLGILILLCLIPLAKGLKE